MTKPKNKEINKYIDDLSAWIDERKKDLNYSLEQFDKLIITLSSGSLALSIGFIKDIVKITKETDTFFLKLSWYLLAISLISVLISQLTSYFTNKTEINLTIDEIRQLEKHKSYDDSKMTIRFKRFFVKMSNLLTISFNAISFSGLIAGIISFIIFINKNI